METGIIGVSGAFIFPTFFKKKLCKHNTYNSSYSIHTFIYDFDCAVEPQSEDPCISNKLEDAQRTRKMKSKASASESRGTQSTTLDGGDGNCSDESDDDLLTEVEMGLYERVVPLCNYRVMDPLSKLLKASDIKFSDSDELDVATFLRSIGLSPKKTVDNDEDDDGNNDDDDDVDDADPNADADNNGDDNDDDSNKKNQQGCESREEGMWYSDEHVSWWINMAHNWWERIISILML